MDKKKIMCAALISVMALSLAACGNKKVDYGMNGGSDDAADERWWCYLDRNTADPASEWIIWLRERSRDPCSVRFLMRLRNG